MGRIIVTTLALAAIWLLLSGYFDHPLLLVFGALSVLLCVWLAYRAGMLDSEGVPISVFPGIIGYMIWLTFEIGKSNILVAREALAIEPKLSPKMFKIPLNKHSNERDASIDAPSAISPVSPQTIVGKVIFANSITLTPGTVSVDLTEDHILVHGLTEELCDVDGILSMGERVFKIDDGVVEEGGA